MRSSDRLAEIKPEPQLTERRLAATLLPFIDKRAVLNHPVSK